MRRQNMTWMASRLTDDLVQHAAGLVTRVVAIPQPERAERPGREAVCDSVHEAQHRASVEVGAVEHQGQLGVYGTSFEQRLEGQRHRVLLRLVAGCKRALRRRRRHLFDRKRCRWETRPTLDVISCPRLLPFPHGLAVPLLESVVARLPHAL